MQMSSECIEAARPFNITCGEPLKYSYPLHRVGLLRLRAERPHRCYTAKRGCKLPPSDLDCHLPHPNRLIPAASWGRLSRPDRQVGLDATVIAKPVDGLSAAKLITSALPCSRGDERSAKLYLRRHLFFTANLAERRLRLLVDDIASAKDDGFRCRSTHPTVLAKAIGLNEVKPITYWVGCAGVLTHSSWTDFLSASHSAGRSRSERRLESLSKRWPMPTTL
jgi:hypothetical protein